MVRLSVDHLLTHGIDIAYLKEHYPNLKKIAVTAPGLAIPPRLRC